VSLPHDLGSLQVLRTVSVHADAQLAAPGGAALEFGLLGSHTSAATGDCEALALRAARPGDAGMPSAAPPGFDLPYGAMRVEGARCSWQTDPAAPPAGITLRAFLGVPDRVPDGAAMWAFGPTSDNATPHWYAIETVVTGRYAQFELADDGTGSADAKPNTLLNATVALAVPRNGASAGALNDLWWVGPQENGWGLSLTQHGSTIFGALFIYDAAGQPTWLVMPGGAWNASSTAYSGKLYRPHGPRYDAYNANQLVVGPSVGTLTLTVSSMGSLTMDYTIDGVTGRKQLQRQRFGAAVPFVYTHSLGDLYWGGIEQNGWGVAIAQQATTLFGVYFTYDASRNPTWFVVPGVDLLSASCCTGTLYRTQSSPWLGQAYDATRFSISPAGSATFSLVPPNASILFVIDGQAMLHPVERQPF
jgi:hypothetical protein